MIMPNAIPDVSSGDMAVMYRSFDLRDRSVQGQELDRLLTTSVKESFEGYESVFVFIWGLSSAVSDV
jgi:hypothetical protein